MGDPFVGIVAWQLIDAGDLNIGHLSGFFLRFLVLGMRAVATVRFFGNSLERLAIILGAHEMARAFITLLVVAIVTLKLGSSRHCTATKIIIGILGHKSSFEFS